MDLNDRATKFTLRSMALFCLAAGFIYATGGVAVGWRLFYQFHFYSRLYLLFSAG